jgi:succinate dehydrogenase flavin-adding protein (antitoxin of CptAB toxin-antitoxin module)
MEDKIYIYLDDIRTPIDPKWIVVRDCDEFKTKIEELGIENINVISLDHDLGDSAMQEYFNNVSPNYTLDYNNITECTGYDLIKWLIDQFYDENPERIDMNRKLKKKVKIKFPTITVHSQNPIGSHNICGLVNNFLKNECQNLTCKVKKVAYSIGGINTIG